MWKVVIFEEDNSLAAVPGFWYQNGICWWPNKNIKKNVERRTKPNEIEFTNFKAKILFDRIGTYLEARTIAQENSEVSSCDNLYEDSSFRRIKKSRTVSNKKESAIHHFSPPKLVSEVEDSECDDTDADKDYIPFLNNNSNNSFGDIDDISDNKQIPHNTSLNCKESTHETAAKQKNSSNCNSTLERSNSSNNKKLKIYHNSVSTPKAQRNLFPKTSLFQTPSQSDPTQLKQTIESIKYKTTPINFEYDNDQGFKKFMTRSITNIKYDIESVNKRLDAFHSLLESINDKLNNYTSHSTLNNDISEKYDNDMICIDNNEDLELVEEKLNNDRQFRAYVILILTRLMGDNLSETVRRIMQKLFTDNFLSKYSYIGFKGKLQFCNLESCAIIIEAVLKMKKFKEVTIKEIEKPVKNWMAQATARIKKQK